MNGLVAALLFLGGAILGSFITVLAYRLPRGEGFVTGRSRCPSCGTQLAVADNIPIVSWLAIRGRCRYCGERVSVRYPLTEAGLGALFVVTYLVLGDDPAWQLALGLTLCAVLVTITLTDLDLRLIPNAVILAGAIAAVALVAVGDPSALDEHLIAGAVAGGVLFLVAMAYPQGMGMGDVKLAAMMGLFLGSAVAPGLLIGFAAGALVGVLMIARHGASARKQAIPFGPFLALGGVVALWVGDEIVDWYLDTFFPG